MNRINLLFLLFFFNISGFQSLLLAQERPNILWITAEDMSPVLGCYGEKDAITPNIDQLAKNSILYTHAFASAPVCSPSRSCLIQGALPPSMGTQHMRSGFPLPSNFNGFPSLLTTRGYYTSNNVKTDYNSGSRSSSNPGWKALPMLTGGKDPKMRCLSFPSST